MMKIKNHIRAFSTSHHRGLRTIGLYMFAFDFIFAYLDRYLMASSNIMMENDDSRL